VDEVLDELARIRSETGWPPLAAPIGQILASQALVHVLSAARYQIVVDELRALVAGRYGTPPAPIDPGVQRAIELVSGNLREEEPAADLAELREEAEGLASSEEELLLLALFGEDAEPLLRTIRDRASGEDVLATGGVDRAQAERIRELVRVVQETGVAEVTIEEAGMRVSVKRSEEVAAAPQPAAGPDELEEAPPAEPERDGLVRVEAPMVGMFYRAAEPGAAPFVQEGETVQSGQTLCILEAMKLMNEIKSDVDAVVRGIHVRNAEPVEFGQLLFELEPVLGRPLDAV
jgi:oxaloacetate decarboxylase (Na+ extruding) subunit alpha